MDAMSRVGNEGTNVKFKVSGITSLMFVNSRLCSTFKLMLINPFAIVSNESLDICIDVIRL